MKNATTITFPLLILFVLVLSALPAFAETRYVSGILNVSLRDSNQKPFKYIGRLKIGEQVELVEVNNYLARVRTKQNVEGWVPLTYLHSEPPSAEAITQLKEEKAGGIKKNDQSVAASGQGPAESDRNDDQKNILNQTGDPLRPDAKRPLAENQKTPQVAPDTERSQAPEKNEIAALREKTLSLQNKLDVLTSNSQDIIAITDERDRLTKDIGVLRAELAKSQELNTSLRNQNDIYWFLAGGAVFLVGLLSGKLFARKKNKLSF